MKFLFHSLIFLFIILQSNVVMSQDFHAGIRAGLCASQVEGDMLAGFNKVGLTGGIFVNRKFSENFAIQMEMVFIQKGSRKPVDPIDNSYYRMRLHYIEVPVLFQWLLNKNLTAYAGPSYGTLVFSQEDTELGIIYGLPPFKKYEISANIGGAYKLGDNWSVDGRYSWSLSTVRPFPGSYNYNFFNRGQYNSVLELSFLYQF